jgi:hypothetical protein
LKYVVNPYGFLPIVYRKKSKLIRFAKYSLPGLRTVLAGYIKSSRICLKDYSNNASRGYCLAGMLGEKYNGRQEERKSGEGLRHTL